MKFDAPLNSSTLFGLLEFRNQENNHVYPTLVSHTAALFTFHREVAPALGRLSRKSCRFVLCHCSPLPTSGISCHGPCPVSALVFAHLLHVQEVPHFQEPTSSQELHLQLSETDCTFGEPFSRAPALLSRPLKSPLFLV